MYLSPHARYRPEFQNLGNFCWWNPECGTFLLVPSENLGFRIQHLAQGIQSPGIQVILTRNPVSSAWNPESTPWNPESKTFFNYLIWGDV